MEAERTPLVFVDGRAETPALDPDSEIERPGHRAVDVESLDTGTQAAFDWGWKQSVCGAAVVVANGLDGQAGWRSNQGPVPRGRESGRAACRERVWRYV